MLRLTKQEQWIVLAVAGLLLLGGATKTWRATHPPEASLAEAAANDHATD